VKKIILVFFLIISSVSDAQVVSLFGVGARFAEDSTCEFNFQAPLLIAGGYKNTSWLYLGEIQYLKDSSKEGSLSVENKQYEVTGYVGYLIDYQQDRIINPYVIAGLGAYKNFLEYNFGATTSRDSSVWETILKVGGGLWSEISSRFVLNLEGKALYSSRLNPELTYELTLRAGLLF
jgi:hypothetical protein